MDRTLLEIFAGEQTEHVQRIRTLIEVLPEIPASNLGGVFDELLRRAHTLKGASRAVGLEATERLVHRAESVFVVWRDRRTLPDEESRTIIHRALDSAEDVLAWALGTRSEPDTTGLIQSLTALAGNAPDEETSVPKPVELPAEPESKVSAVGAATELVRVDTGLLDQVVRSASLLLQMTHSHEGGDSRLSSYAEAVDQTVDEYSRLRRNCAPVLRENAHSIEFRPIVECFEYLDRQLRQLRTETLRIVTGQQQAGRSLRLRAEEMHENACRARMTPARSIFGAFGPMIRDLAEQESKQIEFRAEGLDLQADSEVLQALKDPVMHILRNAVSHGVELPQERLAAGKPVEGSVRLQLESRGDRLRVLIEDDGRGLDTSLLAQRAVRLGLITETAARTKSAESIARLIFEPGMTTSAAVTPLAGRGMGLSAVAHAVSALHGDVSVQHTPGAGVRILISVPMNISTQHVLLIREGNQVFGIPAVFVEHLLRFRPGDVRVISGVESVVVEGRAVPLIRLGDALGLVKESDSSETSSPSDSLTYEAAILASGEDRMGVVIEELLDERETLVKHSGLPRSASGWSTGAIALEDGSVAIMLSGRRLCQGSGEAAAGNRETFQRQERAKVQKSRILVVDDSVTTRALERSILEAHGYEVTLAVDGLEAWTAIQTASPDLVISDINMPRMDGFELLEQIRSQSFSKAIPVILVTSLESREEQEKGLSLGADAYIIKRKFDQRELLKIVQQIV